MEQSDYLQLIHKYLNGELSPEEILVFEKELETSKELRDALRVEKALLLGIEAAGDETIREAITNVDASLESKGFFNKKNIQKPTIIITMKKLLATAAAIAILLIGGWWLFFKDAPQEMLSASEIYEKYADSGNGQINDIIKNLKSYGLAGVQTKEDSLRMALELQVKGKYNESCQLLDSFLVHHPENDTALYYLGMGHMNASRYGAAVKHFTQVESLEVSAFKADVKWNLALCYLMIEGGKGKARQLFQSMAEDPSYTYQNEAVSVLDLLEQ